MAIERNIGPRNLIVVGVLLAIVTLGIDAKFGPPPLVWLNFKYGAVVIYIPWLVALCLTSAGITFLARRSGASLSQRIFFALIPALFIGSMASVVMGAIVVAAALGGHRVYPQDFVGHMLIGWLLVPVGAALLGTLPFLSDSPLKTSGS
jgi:hypothetical protein